MDPAFARALKLAAERQVRRRSFNARLAAVDPDPEATPVSFRCECALIGCSAAIRLTAREYEDVRADPHHFAVLAGHVMPEAETVVELHRGWAVVEKLPGPGQQIAGAAAEARDGAVDRIQR